jgi:hypothetical protein
MQVSLLCFIFSLITPFLYLLAFPFHAYFIVSSSSSPSITTTTEHQTGTSSPPDGRLPNADMGSDVATAQHLRDIFYRMGFDDCEIVALSGAHAIGRCHEDASGYW